jgi:arginine:ornithine antiporter/lysine permease
MGNAAYWVILFSTLGYFFPVFGEGNTRMAIGSASCLLWLFHGMILSGIQTAARLNAAITTIKVIVLLTYIVVVALAFQPSLFLQSFWGQVPWHPIPVQIKSTLLVIVWVFIGIEGASVLSSHAKRRVDIGRATLCGFLIVLVLLMAISLLSFGVMPQKDLATLKNPSMIGIMQVISGGWGALFINVGFLFAVGGSLLAWTLLAAETLFTPAHDGIMPRFLTYGNPRGMPANALWFTNGVTQTVLLITLASSSTYITLISMAATMILVPYLFSAIYACQLALRGAGAGANRCILWRDRFVSVAAVLYCSWLLYGVGLKYLLLSSLLYAPGNILYIWAKREQRSRLFKPYEVVLFVIQLVLATAAFWRLATNEMTL